MADTFTPWPGTSDEEEKDSYYPGALPSPDPGAMGALRDELYQDAEKLIGTDPRFRGLLPGPIAGAGGAGAGVTEPTPEEPDEFTPWPEDLAPIQQEDEPGYLSNKARILGQRALGLTGSVIKGVGELGESLDEYFDTPQIVWGGDEGLRLMPREEFNKLRDAGVTENLITETLPMAFQDRDLGGEKTSSPEKIKEGWKNGDVGGTAAAVGDFILETGMESIADMAFAVYSLPLYITGRTQELAEERVRGKRLSEALAQDAALDPAAQQQLATGYVSSRDVTAQEMGTAAPFAALSSLLERIGAKGITQAGTNITSKVAEEATEAGMKYVLKEGAKAGGKEAATEFFQEGVIEYFVENFNISGEGLFADISVPEGIERGAFAALAGGGTGATLGTGAATLRSLAGSGSDIDPDTGKPVEVSPEVLAETEAPAFDVPPEGFSEAERQALEETLDAQSEPTQGELPLPSQEGQASTPTPEPIPTAPTPAEGVPTPTETAPAPTPPVEDEVVTADDLVTEPLPDMGEAAATPEEVEAVTQREEALAEPTPTEAAPAESPMIQRKDVEAGFRELNKRTKDGMPGIRKAVRALGTAVTSIFPDAKNLPSLKGTIGPERMADFFAKLDEEVVIDETLPNLKGFLTEVLDSPDAATAVQNINRLKDYVANSGAGVVQGETTPFLEQASRGLTAFEAYEAERVSTKQKYKTVDKGKKSPTFGKVVERERITGPKNRLVNRAVAVDELATTVTALTTKATELGINVPAEVTETIRRARSYRESSQTAQPRTLKGGAGATVVSQKFTGKNLTEVSGILREAAQSLIKQIAAVDQPGAKTKVDKPKTAKGKAKAAPKKPVTEAPAKPKKAEKAKKVSKAKAKKKAAPKKPATVRGAKPEDVIEVTPTPTRGKQAGKVVEALGAEPGTTLDAALATSGISKKSANTVKALIQKADAEGQTKIIQAIKNYQGPEDNLNLVTTIEEVLGGQVAPQNMMDVLQFVEGMAENRATTEEQDILASDEAMAEEAAANGMSLEDYKEIMAETGRYSEEAAEAESPWSDDYQDMSTDEWENSQWMTSKNLPKGAVESGQQLLRALINRKTGLLGFLSEYTKLRGMPDPGPTSVDALLKAIIKSLPRNNRYYPLAWRLLQLELDVPVYVYDEPFLEVEGNNILGSYYPGNNYDPAGRKIRLYVGENTDPRHIFATALHEIVHAATIAGYKTDAKFRSELDALYDRAVLEMDRQNPDWRTDGTTSGQMGYGLVNAREFIAEALTNPEFQQWLSDVDSINVRNRNPVAETIKGLMRDIVNTIKKYLGYSIRNSLLEDVLVLADENLMSEPEVLVAQQKQQVQAMRAEQAFKTDPTKVSARNDILDANKNTDSLWRRTVEKIADTTKSLAAKGNLGLSNLDVMERDYRSLFTKAASAMKMANPLTTYTKAKSSASVLARKYERQAYQMLKKLQKVDNQVRSQMEGIMRDVTLSNIDPTQPLNSAANKHLWTKGSKNKKPKIRKKYADKAPQARQNWLNFQKRNPEAAGLLEDMAGLTRQIHDTKVRSSLYALGEAFDLRSSDVKGLQSAKTAKDIDAVIPPNEVEVIEKQIAASDPTMAKTLGKVLAQAEARAEVAKSAKRILKESTIDGWYFPLRRYGEYVVSTESDVTGDDKYVSFHTTKAEAKRVAAALNAKYPDNPVNVSLKIEKASSTADVKSVIGDLQRRFRGDDNKATRDRLKGAMAEVLASNAAYQSQLKRANVDGVAASDMARGFEEYVHVSKYTIGDLLVSHKIADAINNMNTLEADAPITNDERVKLGRVVNEIKDRNNEDAKDRVMSPFQRTVGLIGFFNFLGAPSYWALNATQTYTVTLPYIISKWGAKAPTALAKSQGTVLNAVGRALNSKDKSYEGFKAQLPPAARKVVEVLEAENIIQSTIAHEFGDMLSPNAMNNIRQHALGAPVAKTSEMAMQIMEKVPEAVEHYNRISTALAIYNLSGGDITATTDGVQATQFNYDTGNRARLLKTFPKFLGGGGRPLVTPIMMFKTYGIGIARLLYGGMIDTVYKEGGRTEAAKLVAGLITSHTLFGGVAGGLMMAPIMAIQAAANAIFSQAGDEWDLEEGIEEWSKEIGNDWIATAARRGIPAATLGIDMSRSVNLGNLMWMSDDRLDAAKYGDAEKILIRNVGGPIVSYGISAWRAGAQLVDNEFREGWSEFAEAAVPLKAYRGLSQAVRYNTEGIETRGELEFVPAKEFSSTLQTMLGFQATQKTQVREQYYSEQARLERRSGRKAKLLQWANDAIRDNDQEAIARVMDDIEEFNESIAKRPEDRQYRVTARDLAMLRSRRRSAQREYDKKFRYSD